MYRVIPAAVLAALLVIAAGTGTIGQSASPEWRPPLAGRVEMPEHGLAVSIPDDWVGLDPSGDLDGQLDDVDDWLDPTPSSEFAEGLRGLWDLSRREDVPMLLVGLDATQVCVIQPVAQVPPDRVLPREMGEQAVRFLWVLCQGDTRPQDDAVARALEPLPSPTESAPTGG